MGQRKPETTFDPADAGWVTAAHAAKLLTCSKKTVVRNIADDDETLRGVQQPDTGHWYVDPGSITETLARRQQEVASLPSNVRALRPEAVDQNAALRQQVAALTERLAEVADERDQARARVAELTQRTERLKEAVRSLRTMADLGLDGLLD